MLGKVATTGVDLNSVYDQTLRRIKEQKGGRSKLGMEVLMWASHAERAMRIDELCHALAVEMEATDLDLENVSPQDTVLGSCLGLVVVDKQTSTVRLIHYTVQGYLSQPGILPGAHRVLGQTCLTYLNYDRVKMLPANNVSNLGDMSLNFLEYSSLHWVGHAKIELSDHAKSLALQLLNRHGDHISTTLLLDKIRGYDLRPSTRHLFPGLHCASYFGVDEIVAALIEMQDCDINQRDYMGLTPLIWAARQGNQGTVMLLLTRDDINPDKPDNNSQTPLGWASENGHEEVLRLLLARGDVNPDELDSNSTTPLSWASFYGHEGVVRLLLAQDDVNPDKPNKDGETPLWRASRRGHEGVMRLLLARDDVNPNKSDKRGRTPLWWASVKGIEGVVKLLLARNDINPDKSGNHFTPLWWASNNGHEGVVRLLLTRDDVNPNKPNNRGQTPLWMASYYGHEGVVRLLLTRDDVNPNKPDQNGRTPFCQASSKGHEGVVRLLLARGAVTPDKPDNDGITSCGSPLFKIGCG